MAARPGTTGRHHGLLHSGARYAVNDKESAVECIEENTLLRRIAPGSFEQNDGLFVRQTDEDLADPPTAALRRWLIGGFAAMRKYGEPAAA